MEYPQGGSSKKCSHVYFLSIVAIVPVLWHQFVQLWHQVTMVASEQHLYQTIVLPRKLAIGSIHDYLFCYGPLVGILFEVLRIEDGNRACVWCRALYRSILFILSDTIHITIHMKRYSICIKIHFVWFYTIQSPNMVMVLSNEDLLFYFYTKLFKIINWRCEWSVGLPWVWQVWAR